MRRTNYRANATEINKTPTKIRFIFVLDLSTKPNEPDTICAITTYRTLSENLKLGVSSIKVVDLVQNEVISLRPELMNSLLDEWRNNYFNPGWRIPSQFIC